MNILGVIKNGSEAKTAKMKYAGKNKKRKMMVALLESMIISCFLNIKAAEQVLVKNGEFRKKIEKRNLKGVWQGQDLEDEEIFRLFELYFLEEGPKEAIGNEKRFVGGEMKDYIVLA